MGQEEVLEILKEKGLITADEIAKIIRISVVSVRKSLNKMLKFNEIERVKIRIKHSKESYAWRYINSEFTKDE
jgi:predicted transcriptional regulator